MVDNDVILDKIDFDRSDFDLVDLVDVVDKIDFDRSGRNSRGWGTRRKVWTRTKILSPNVRYFVAN